MGQVNKTAKTPVTGLAGWLLSRMRRTTQPKPRLALLERIALAPKQSLVLVEAEGRRFLVATSAEGAAAFYSLDEQVHAGHRGGLARGRTVSAARVSW
jgi:flagellar biogenesis protein FliO